ncbi:hypothetical protein [Actinomadura formosensis]|uniref:hypothetical protein n=1 Tax=Actinomadura formosensis TaxID=60706 RepID=UPI000AF85BB4|nr:hypothetical protein [Actinomadura formosensis]
MAPVIEWAIETKAKNLSDPTETPVSSIAPELREQLNAIELFGGGNGWAGAHEKEDARHRLHEFRGTGPLDPDAIGAYMLGRGLTDTAYKNIRKIVLELNR